MFEFLKFLFKTFLFSAIGFLLLVELALCWCKLFFYLFFIISGKTLLGFIIFFSLIFSLMLNVFLLLWRRY